MRRFVALAALALFAALGCSSKEKPEISTLNVTVSVDSGSVPTVQNGVKADGHNTVTIHVSGGKQAPIHVTTTKGSFPGGATTATIEGTEGSVALAVCDARKVNGCAGVNGISATDAVFTFGQASVSFVGYETGCSTNGDSNSDSRLGCADPDCDQQDCVTTMFQDGSCQSLACVADVCTPTGTIEVCDNTTDDDCDGNIDCMQTTCEGKACKPGSPTFVCRNQACTDLGSGFAITATPKRPRIPADGVATTTISFRVTKANVIQASARVDITTDLGAFIINNSPTTSATVTTGNDGNAVVTYQASATTGTATIGARLHDLQAITAETHVTMPALGGISLSAVQTEVMGVKFSGFNEQNRIAVLLLDADLKPYPDGLAVRFEHQQLLGSTLSDPLAPDTATCHQNLGCVASIGHIESAVANPDTAGVADMLVYSGTASGLLEINVTATAGGASKTLSVKNIAVVGAKASGAHISLSCNPQRVLGFDDNDCTNSFNELIAPIQCTVFLADRFNNVLGVATRADFRSEAGSAGPPVTTRPYDPRKGGDQTADIGFAIDSILVNGYRLPSDVPPYAEGEASHKANVDGCGERIHNPRDGLSSVIVSVQGEEGFVDLNGNGVYESGEPFIDSGEPFVDENDSGVREADEPFVDVNRNGVWDGPNGAWDSNAVIWAETRVLYSHSLDFIWWVDPKKDDFFPDPPGGFSVTAEPQSSQKFVVHYTDDNLNHVPDPHPMALSFTTKNANVSTSAKTPVFPDNQLGLSLTQQFCDKAPPAATNSCFATCKSAPCYRVAKVGSFSYGTTSEVTITGLKVGPDEVTAKVANTLPEAITGSVAGEVK